jgi:hypothetical protein
VLSSSPSPGPARSALVTSRNNSHIAWWTHYDTPFREVRPYVAKCCTGTLAVLHEAGRVSFSALPCGSWSCPTCRKVLSAQLLDRFRRGSESRGDLQRTLLTLTLDPSRFGASAIGQAFWDQSGHPTVPWKAVRRTTLWSPPTADQFHRACVGMSSEWDRLNKRLGVKCQRAGLDRFGYFRVVELHRNGWPHYHAVLEHPHLAADDVDRQLAGWSLGRYEASPVSLDDAVGEVAPYLVCAERKASSHKAYQFAATALPHNFRLYSASRGFLADPLEPELELEHSFAVRGHFTSHHEAARAWGADSRIALKPPQEKDHKPPSSSLAMGEAATLYYLELLSQTSVHIPAGANFE